MAASSDHFRRDAEHAARNEISTCLGKFARRMNEAAKGSILEAVQNVPSVVDFDWGTALGRTAANAAIRDFLFDNPQEITSRPSD